MDITTSVDLAVESLVTKRIAGAYPFDSIVAEEGSSVNGTTTRRWIVDPLDGTANYARGWPVCAVSIGVEVDGRFTVGAVYNPFLNEMYVAGEGIGAFLNGERLEKRTEDVEISEAFVGITGGYDLIDRGERGGAARALIAEAGDVRYTGSAALDYCHVASGRLDAAFGNGYRLWDMAAGSVIATESGCLVVDLEGRSAPLPPEAILVAVPSVEPAVRAIVSAAVAESRRSMIY
ncbi:inositol monophosphatase [Actinoplanes sp. NBRC 103695]|nr:inositol monophosphatase [Actinoplanes sp. NBRC 103695]